MPYYLIKYVSVIITIKVARRAKFLNLSTNSSRLTFSSIPWSIFLQGVEGNAPGGGANGNSPL